MAANNQTIATDLEDDEEDDEVSTMSPEHRAKIMATRAAKKAYMAKLSPREQQDELVRDVWTSLKKKLVSNKKSLYAVCDGGVSYSLLTAEEKNRFCDTVIAFVEKCRDRIDVQEAKSSKVVREALPF